MSLVLQAPLGLADLDSVVSSAQERRHVRAPCWVRRTEVPGCCLCWRILSPPIRFL